MLGTAPRSPSSMKMEETSGGRERSMPPSSPKNRRRSSSPSTKRARAPSKERVSAAIAFVRARNQKSPSNENGLRLGSPRGSASSIRLPLSPRMNSPSARQQGSEKAFFGSNVPPSIDTKDNATPSPSSSVGQSSPLGRRSRRLAAAKHAEYKAQTSPRTSYPPSSPQSSLASTNVNIAKKKDENDENSSSSENSSSYPPSSPPSSFASTTVNIARQKDENDESSSSSESSSSIDTNVVLGLADFIDALNKSSTETTSSEEESLAKNDASSEVATSVPSAALDSEMLKNLGDFIDRLNHQNSHADDNDIILNSSSDEEEEVDSQTLQNIASFIDTIARAKSAIGRPDDEKESVSDENVPADISAEEKANASENSDSNTVNDTTEETYTKSKEPGEGRESPNGLLYLSSSEDFNPVAGNEKGTEEVAFSTTSVEHVTKSSPSSNVECPVSTPLGAPESDTFSSPKSSSLDGENVTDIESTKIEHEAVENEVSNEATKIFSESGSTNGEAALTEEPFSEPVPSLVVSSSDGSQEEKHLAYDEVEQTQIDRACLVREESVEDAPLVYHYDESCDGAVGAATISSSDEDLFSGLEPSQNATDAEKCSELSSDMNDTPSARDDECTAAAAAAAATAASVSNASVALDFNFSVSAESVSEDTSSELVQDHVEASDRIIKNEEPASPAEVGLADESAVVEGSIVKASSSLDMSLSAETYDKSGSDGNDHIGTLAGAPEIGEKSHCASGSTMSLEEMDEAGQDKRVKDDATDASVQLDSAVRSLDERSLVETAYATSTVTANSGKVSESLHGIVSSGSEWTEEVCTSSSDQTIEVTIGTSEDYSIATKQSNPKADASSSLLEQTEESIAVQSIARSISSHSPRSAEPECGENVQAADPSPKPTEQSTIDDLQSTNVCEETIEATLSNLSLGANIQNGEDAPLENRGLAEEALLQNDRGEEEAPEACEISQAISDDRESYLLNAFLTGSDMDISIDPILPDPSTMESIDEDENIARFQERMSSSSETRSQDRDDCKIVQGTDVDGENVETADVAEAFFQEALAESGSTADQGVECTEIMNEVRSETDEKDIKASVWKALVAGETYEDTILETISEDRESYLLNAFLAGSNAEISVDPILPDPSTMDSVDEEENIARFQERIASLSNETHSQDHDALHVASTLTNHSENNKSDLTNINGDQIEISKDVIDVAHDASLIVQNVSRTILSIDAGMDNAEEEIHAKAGVTSPGGESQESYLFNAFLAASNTEISLDPILPDPSTMESLDEDENIERFLAKTFTLPEGATKGELLMLNTFIKDVTDLVENGGTPEQRQNLVKKAIRDGIPKDMIEEVIISLVCASDSEDASTSALSQTQETTEPETALDTGVVQPTLVEPSSTGTSLGEELERILSDPRDKEIESEGSLTPKEEEADDKFDRVAEEESAKSEGLPTPQEEKADTFNHLTNEECRSESPATNEMRVVEETDAATTREEIDVMDTFIDKLAPREGASANEIELLSQFMKLSAPVLAGKALSQEEETKLRRAAGGVGISEKLLDKLLRSSVSPKQTSSPSSRKTNESLAGDETTLDRIEHETGAYLSNAPSRRALSSSVEVDVDDDAVEVSFDMSTQEQELAKDTEGENQEIIGLKDDAYNTNSPLNSVDIIATEPEVLVSRGKPPSGRLTVLTNDVTMNEDIHRAVWTPVADFQDERYAMPLTPSSQIEPQRITSVGDPSFEEMNQVVSPRTRIPRRHRSRYSPSAKGLVTPSRLGGSAAAAVIARWSPRRASRCRLPVKQQWKLSYRERTKNHPGYFEVNQFSLKEMAVPVAAPHYLDNVPWEDREVKQRFLHEHSVSFSRNWFGELPRKRGNDKHREPVARPDSMAMPMTHRQDRNWPEEWYTTWQSRRLFGVEDDYEDSSTGSFSSGSSRTSDDHTGSLLSGSVLSESIYTRETRETRETDSFLDEARTDEYTWDDYDEDTPECGYIVNVKQKIGERVTRVNPYTTSSLRRSRWRRKWFPRGTFPY